MATRPVPVAYPPGTKTSTNAVHRLRPNDQFCWLVLSWSVKKKNACMNISPMVVRLVVRCHFSSLAARSQPQRGRGPERSRPNMTVM